MTISHISKTKKINLFLSLKLKS